MKACISGITGQTGSYLAELLLEEGYDVYGLIRRSSSFNTGRIDYIYDKLNLTYGDLADYSSLSNWVGDLKPDLLFNMGAMSHVRVSFDIPEYTMDVTGTSVIRLLETVRKVSPKTRFLTASTSISGDTKVLIRKNGITELVEIEKLSNPQEEKTLHDNLECLTVNDKYQTKWSKVAYVFGHKASNIYKLKGSGGLNLTLTGDHSVMIMNANGDLVEKAVEDLDKNDFLLSFVTEQEGSNPSFDMSKYKNGLRASKLKREIKKVDVNPEIMRLIGFYLSEGSLYIKDGKNYSITFTFHIKEVSYCEDIKRIISEQFGINSSYEVEIPDQTVRKLTVCSKQFSHFLLEHFGKLAKGKKIPYWVYTLPKSSFLEMMRGYMGDAKLGDNEIVYTSANKNMIEQLAYASKLHGMDCRITQRFNKPHRLPQGTVMAGSFCWDLKFSGKNRDLLMGEGEIDRSKFKSLNQDLIPGKTFRKLSDIKYQKLIKNKKSISKRRVLECREINAKLKAICLGDLHVVRIKSIEKVNRTMMVYDLHVPETQMFIGGNYPVLLHNSELFGSSPPPQNEQTPFHPRSPYAVAKLAGYWATINYREAYGLFATNAIMFNTESVRRGETFVTRKITRAATRIKVGLQNELVLGNTSAKRDWNHNKDTVRGMLMMLTADDPDDYVLASGEMHSVQEFLELVFAKLDLDWKKYVRTDEKYYRPAEVDALCGDSTKIREKLGWKPQYSFNDLVEEMVQHDMRLAKRELG